MDLNKPLERLSNLADARNKIQLDFLKQILLLASTLFGVLISFRISSGEHNLNTLFGLALLSLALGILVGVIALYSHVYMSRNLFVQYKKAIEKQIRERADNVGSVVINTPKIFLICEVACGILLCLSLLLFCLFIFLQ